jgi:hypothetical protein
LSTDFFLDYIGRDKKSRLRFTQSIPVWLKDINWNKTGIGLPDKIALFSMESANGSQVNIQFIMPLSNAAKFHVFMDTISRKLQLTVNKKRGIKWIYSKPTGFLMAWDNQFVTGTKTTENIDRRLISLYNTLTINREQSLMMDSCFSNGAKKKYDVFFYTTPYRYCPVKKLDIINSAVNTLVSFVNFKDGELKATTEINAKAGSNLDNIFIGLNGDCPGLANENKATVHIRMNINPDAFRSFYNQFRFVGFKSGNILGLDAWDGRLSLLFNGTKTIENTFISYEYDNDFNKIETKKIGHEKVLDIQAAAGVNHNILNRLWKRNPPVKEGLDTLLFKGGRFVLKRNGTFYIIYNKEFQRPIPQSITARNNIEITGDYKRLSPILKEMGMESKTDKLDSLTLDRFNISAYKQGNIFVKTNISFADKDINAFFTLLEKGISLFR